MKYQEWLQILHPATRQIYHRIMHRRNGDDLPTFLVFIDSTPYESALREEIWDWCHERTNGRFWEICDVDADTINLLGFEDEMVAMEFKLAYGNGYDPRTTRLV